MNKTLGSTFNYLRDDDWRRDACYASHICWNRFYVYSRFYLFFLWILLTYSALLFVEVYQTAEHDAGIGTLAAQYFGRPGRIVATSVLMIFLYALLSAYVTGGGAILASTLPDFATPDLKMKGLSWHLRSSLVSSWLLAQALWMP